MGSIPLVIFRFFLHRRTRYVLAWLVAIGAASLTLFFCWRAFDPPKRPDGAPKRPGGNYGHTTIDFGGQWLMGRMLVKGFGKQLYDRNYQRLVVREAYPREEETPDEDRSPEEKGQHEADNLMGWLMGQDDPKAAAAVASFLVPLAACDPLGVAALTRANQDQAEARLEAATQPQVGGPLYPPIHALFMYPLGHLRPAYAYRIVQVLCILLAFVAGWGIRLLSQGRIWWPVAVALMVLYPSFGSCVSLGQNSVILLTLFIWGWTCIVRDRPIAAGVLWGIMAFKPVWPAAFFLVPLLTKRWPVCVAMLATGLALAAATLPLVGWENWLRWLEVGRRATMIYHADENWVFISRDLLNIPRRWLLDFQVPYTERDNLASQVAGALIFVTVLGLTVSLTLWRADRKQALTGPPAAFLLLGAWMSCFHFMYYDVLLTALPVLLLLTQPRRYFQPILVGLLPVPEAECGTGLVDYFQPRLATGLPPKAAVRRIYVVNSLTLSLLALLAITEFLFPLLNITISVSAAGLAGSTIPMPLKYATGLTGTPWNLFCLMALWLWCGWLWLRTPQTRVEGGGPSAAPSEGSASSLKTDAAQLV